MKQFEELPSRDVVAIALFQACRHLAQERLRKSEETYIKGLIHGYLYQAIERCEGMSEQEIAEQIEQQLAVKNLAGE